MVFVILPFSGVCFALPAFPGAEGFGAQTKGGRGGKVYLITNTNDNGPGSLRECLEASGPRIAVFQTGGTISLQSTLTISNPFLTIAGQSAPGGGITIRGNGKTAIRIKTHDVVMRYLSIRVGSGGQTEGIAIYDLHGDVHSIVVDHCSVSWATDEVMQTWYGAHDVTFQWNIISEGLNCSTHREGCHSKGPMFGSENSKNFSFHHNLVAHNIERNPLAKTPGPIDITNNVFYNSKSTPALAWDMYGQSTVNFIGNYHKLGPNSRTDSLGMTSIRLVNQNSGAGYRVFVDGNIGPLRTADSIDDLRVVRVDSGVASGWSSSKRLPTPPITTTDARAAYKDVLDYSGNSKGIGPDGIFITRRDSIDERIVEEVLNTGGAIIDDESEVGGWVSIARGVAQPDSDKDGMPDAWETKNGCDPHNPSDNAMDFDGDGYTNIEEYLNCTAGVGNGSNPIIPMPPVDLRILETH
jgi:pectate lyase